eukprot:m.116823 g.116823  ORF g.116823 m.116823 type:complete len:932 (-) comp13159_c0_seq2:132-2927(-)
MADSTAVPVPARRPTETYANRRRPTSKREIEDAQGRDKVARKPISAVNAVRAKQLAEELDAAGGAYADVDPDAERVSTVSAPAVTPKPAVPPKPSPARAAEGSTVASPGKKPPPPPPVRRTSELSHRSPSPATPSSPSTAEPVTEEAPAATPDAESASEGEAPPAARSAPPPPPQRKKPPLPPARADSPAAPSADDAAGDDGASSDPAAASAPPPPLPPPARPPPRAPAVILPPEGEYAVPMDEEEEEAAAAEAPEESAASRGPPPPIPRRAPSTSAPSVAPPMPPRGKKPLLVDDSADHGSTPSSAESTLRKPPPPPPAESKPRGGGVESSGDGAGGASADAEATGGAADASAYDTPGDVDGDDLGEEAGPTVYCAPPPRQPPIPGGAHPSDASGPAPPRPSRPPLDLPPPETMRDGADEFGYVVDEDVYEPIDQHFRDRSETQKDRLIKGTEEIQIEPPEQIYDSIPGDMPDDGDSEADYTGAGLVGGAAPPVPAPYSPKEGDAGSAAQPPPPGPVRWWPGKKKAASAPPEYIAFIDGFGGARAALMTVTATKAAANKAYAELPFDLGEVIEIIQMDDCPPGKWVGRSLANGYFGFVKCADVRVDPSQLRAVMEAAAVRRETSLTSAEGISLGNKHAKLGIQQTNPSSASPPPPTAAAAAAPTATGSAPPPAQPSPGKRGLPSIKRQPRPSDTPPLPPPSPGGPSSLPPETLGVYSSIEDDAPPQNPDPSPQNVNSGVGEEADLGSYGTAKSPAAVPRRRPPPRAVEPVPEEDPEAVYDAMDDANLPDPEDVPPELPKKPHSYEEMQPGVFFSPGAPNDAARVGTRDRPRSSVMSMMKRPVSIASSRSSGSTGGGRPGLAAFEEEGDGGRNEGGYDNARLMTNASQQSTSTVASMKSNPEYGVGGEDLPPEEDDAAYDTLSHATASATP